jgi:hypothetical protein
LHCTMILTLFALITHAVCMFKSQTRRQSS